MNLLVSWLGCVLIEIIKECHGMAPADQKKRFVLFWFFCSVQSQRRVLGSIWSDFCRLAVFGKWAAALTLSAHQEHPSVLAHRQQNREGQTDKRQGFGTNTQGEMRMKRETLKQVAKLLNCEFLRQTYKLLCFVASRCRYMNESWGGSDFLKEFSLFFSLRNCSKI